MAAHDPAAKLRALKEAQAKLKQGAQVAAQAKSLLQQLNKAESTAATAKKELEGEADEGEE